MATLIQPKNEAQLRKLGVANVRDEYKKLADSYNKIIDGQLFYCHKCNGFYNSEAFYSDKRYASGLFPECKKCLLAEATDFNKDLREPVDNKEKTIEVFHKLDIPFIDDLYNSSLQDITEKLGEKNRGTAYQHLLVQIKSLKQYQGMTFKDSKFNDNNESSDDIDEDSKVIKAAKRRFGTDFSLDDLFFLETQYEDWISRYECNTKAQEEIFERLSWKKLEIRNATKQGLPTKDLDKTYQELLATANITPRQSSMDTFADAQTLGTLIQKWEMERPLPEIDPELQDVDKIGLYIDAFYRGHASKMLGLKNSFVNLYEKVISKYTVKPPTYEDSDDSEDVFNQIFGSVEDY